MMIVLKQNPEDAGSLVSGTLTKYPQLDSSVLIMQKSSLRMWYLSRDLTEEANDEIKGRSNKKKKNPNKQTRFKRIS